MKKQNKASGSYPTETLVDDNRHANDGSFHGIVRDVPINASWGVLGRKEVLLPLLAHRIAQLSLTQKKILAMYYHENLPISEIAACLNLPATQIDEILTTCRYALERTIECISRKFAHEIENAPVSQ
ncbi:MAG: hypothetical protein JO334_16310 [Verrucomicrobia bacterium]|nr:hypothetical protein [Verrucomicrobiota bacterium]